MLYMYVQYEALNDYYDDDYNFIIKKMTYIIPFHIH